MNREREIFPLPAYPCESSSMEVISLMQHLGTRLLMTERLRLTPLRAEDLDDVAAWTCDPAVYACVQAEPKTYEQTRAVLRSILDSYQRQDTYYWAIRRQGEDRCIGCIFVDMLVDAGKWCSLDFLLARREWGKSYLSEALKTVIDFLIGEVGFHRVQAKTPISDRMNGHVFLKIGMIRDGVLRECFRAKDAPDSWYDVAVYSILESEWRHLREWQRGDRVDDPMGL